MKYVYDLRYTKGYHQVSVKDNDRDHYYEMILALTRYDSNGKFSNGNQPGTLRFENEEDAIYVALKYS